MWAACSPHPEHKMPLFQLCKVQENTPCSCKSTVTRWASWYKCWNVKYRYLAASEKDERLRELHTQHRNTTKRLRRLEEKLALAIDEKGKPVDESTHSDLRQIMEECSAKVTSEYPEGSIACVFWEQQLKAASCRDWRQVRWHPIVVKWYLYLRQQSSSAYESLRQSGCLLLPSQRTQRDYTHYANTMIGFSDEVDKQFMEIADISSLSEYQKCVVIILDEMHIKEGLVYDKHSGALVGFTDLGNINNLLTDLERSLASGSGVPTPALSKLCLFSWCTAYWYVFNSLMHSLHVHRSLATRSSILFGSVSCALRGVGSLSWLQLPMVLHVTELSWVSIDLKKVQASPTRSSIPSQVVIDIFTLYWIHHICWKPQETVGLARNARCGYVNKHIDFIHSGNCSLSHSVMEKKYDGHISRICTTKTVEQRRVQEDCLW